LELGVLPDHLVADRRLQEVAVLVDPALEIESRQGHEPILPEIRGIVGAKRGDED
jgi:hypothetical protein